jgi:hypothetical protein
MFTNDRNMKIVCVFLFVCAHVSCVLAFHQHISDAALFKQRNVDSIQRQQYDVFRSRTSGVKPLRIPNFRDFDEELPNFRDFNEELPKFRDSNEVLPDDWDFNEELPCDTVTIHAPLSPQVLEMCYAMGYMDRPVAPGVGLKYRKTISKDNGGSQIRKKFKLNRHYDS